MIFFPRERKSSGEERKVKGIGKGTEGKGKGRGKGKGVGGKACFSSQGKEEGFLFFPREKGRGIENGGKA